MAISIEPFGKRGEQEVLLFIVTRETAIGPVEIALSSYGATLIRCLVPDARGALHDVVLGYDRLEHYVEGKAYFGAIAGRYGNRIRDSRIQIDGRAYNLVPNEGANQLHGGPMGFDKAIWSGRAVNSHAVRFDHVSPDGDMGFPGRLMISVTYALLEDGSLAIDMEAVTDQPTFCNPVQHAYWNLGGHASGDVLDHVVMFNAGFYTPVDDALLPTGEILKVEGTPFDFRRPTSIRTALHGASSQFLSTGAYDHNLVLDQQQPVAAEILNPANRLGLRLMTSEPGLQFYTGGYLGPEIVGKGGHAYSRHGGFTLETQKFPCSPDFSHFPSARLNPGDGYHHSMRLSFFHASP